MVLADTEEVWAERFRAELGRPYDPPKLVLFTGASFAVSQMLWFLGLEYTSVANATLLLSLTPLIAALILWLVFREVIGRRFWFGMLLAISGMAGLTYASTASPDNSLHGDILCVFAVTSSLRALEITGASSSLIPKMIIRWRA